MPGVLGRLPPDGGEFVTQRFQMEEGKRGIARTTVWAPESLPATSEEVQA